MKTLRFAITGANGQLGSVLVQYLRKKGHVVFELVRTQEKAIDQQYYLFFDLEKPEEMPNLKGIDVLIHAAYFFDVSCPEKYYVINVDGSRALFLEANECCVPYKILISTISAYKNSRSLYGKTKYEIEQIYLKNSLVLRPGLILNDPLAGIAGVIQKFVRKYTLVPSIGAGNQMIYPCPIEDLVEKIFHCSIHHVYYHQPIFVGKEIPITLKQLILQFSKQEDKKIYIIPIPFFVIYAVLKLLETIKISIGFRSDSLIGLQYANPEIDFDSARKIHTQ